MKNSIRKSRSGRSGLILPVSRIHRYLRQGKLANRIGSVASIYLAAVLEYLVAEIIQTAAIATIVNKKKRITTRFINLAIRNDTEINTLLMKVHIRMEECCLISIKFFCVNKILEKLVLCLFCHLHFVWNSFYSCIGHYFTNMLHFY